jgi:predicted amidohydrolase YtcJ
MTGKKEPSAAADLILENAAIITGRSDIPVAEALAIQGNRILFIGSQIDVEQFRKKSTRVINCTGKTLVPGFNDAHCHFFSLVRKLFSLDLSPAVVHSIKELQESIRRKACYTPGGRWIRGTDYNEFYLEEKRHPTRLDLDKAAPGHPVIISHRSLHACVLNSLALQMLGINKETEEPSGGMIERDLDTGEPNGILYEMENYVRSRISFSLSEAELDWGINEVNRQYLSMGITSIGESTVTNDLDQWQTYSRLKSQGKILSRIYMMPGISALNEFKEAGLITGAGDHDLKLGSLKIILSETTGQLQPSRIELNRMVLEANQAGFQVAIHAVEQSTVAAAVASLEYAASHFPQSSCRNRIEHCSECPPVLRSKLRKLQAVIVSQPPFVYYHGERYLAQVPSDTQPWLYPFKSLLDSGLVVAGSSDSPVVPNNPLHGIYAAVTRQTESGQLLNSKEVVSIRQALEMYTCNAAYASFEENVKGTLSPGYLADIIMLSENPLISPPQQLKDISIDMTLIGGQIVWESGFARLHK